MEELGLTRTGLVSVRQEEEVEHKYGNCTNSEHRIGGRRVVGVYRLASDF